MNTVEDEAGSLVGARRRPPHQSAPIRKFLKDCRKRSVQSVFDGRSPHPWTPRPLSYGRIRSYIHTMVPHFHVCHGMRPGGPFLQENEAWVVHDMVIDHVGRVVFGEVADG